MTKHVRAPCGGQFEKPKFFCAIDDGSVVLGGIWVRRLVVVGRVVKSAGLDAEP